MVLVEAMATEGFWLFEAVTARYEAPFGESLQRVLRRRSVIGSDRAALIRRRDHSSQQADRSPLGPPRDVDHSTVH